MTIQKFYIFANGVLRDTEYVRKLIQPGDCIIAVDGGGNYFYYQKENYEEWRGYDVCYN